MMMTGGQGCTAQCTGPGKGDAAICNFTTPQHCPGQTDNEYRTEASLYAVVSSPMMIGTDIRLMTPIMKELLLNKDAIAINRESQSSPAAFLYAACGSLLRLVCAATSIFDHIIRTASNLQRTTKHCLATPRQVARGNPHLPPSRRRLLPRSARLHCNTKIRGTTARWERPLVARAPIRARCG